SRLPQGYAQNHAAASAYSVEIRYGKFATTRGAVLSNEDRLRAEIIECIMCSFRVDIDRLVAKHRLPPIFSREPARIDLLATQGLVRRLGRRIEVTERGRPFTRIVASLFDRYLEAGQPLHSNAV